MVRLSWNRPISAATDAVIATADRARTMALRWTGAKSRYRSTRYGRLHAIDLPGDGPLPPVILLHGISSAGADYAAMLRRLRPWTRRIIAPDLPGHGLSSMPPASATPQSIVEALAECLDDLLHEPAIVFGNSMGGFVGVRYALARPGRVLGLFLVSPAGAWCPAQELETLMDTLRVEDLEKARAFMRKVLPSSSLPIGLLAWGVRARMSRPAIQRLLEDTCTSDLLTPSELAALRMPITLVWGKKEEILPRSHFAFFRQHLPPQTRFEAPEEFGHAPFLDRPDEVAAMLYRFAQDVSAESATGDDTDYPLG